MLSADTRSGPLVDVRVVELATMIAGPTIGRLLADQGADVIKVELPGAGDDARRTGHARDGVSLMWKVQARNKRLVSLDVRNPRGRSVFLALLQTADMLIESFRPGTLEAWRLSPKELWAVRPELTIVRVSGFGQTGPAAQRAGFGTLAEAMSGFAHANGWPDGPPTLPPFGLADGVAGLAGAFGGVAALLEARSSGRGQVVDVALYEPLMSMMSSQVIDYDQLGVNAAREGNRTRHAAPRNMYRCRDGRWMAVSASTQRTAARLFEVMGSPELIEDPRYSTNERRCTNAEALDREIGRWFQKHEADDLVDALRNAGVPAGFVYTAESIWADPHMSARTIVQVSDDQLGAVRVQAPMPLFSGTPGRIRNLGGPVGANTREVLLGELGLTEAEFDCLQADGAI